MATQESAVKRSIKIFLTVLTEQVLRPLKELEKQRDLDTAQGVWLDYIGERIGLPRPEAANPALDERFGFDRAGEGFDQHPFSGSDANKQSFPLSDYVYRNIIKARGIAVRSDGNLDDFVVAIKKIDPHASASDPYNMTVRVVTDQANSMRIADRVGAIPRPAGVKLIVVDRDRFGYDEAGVPFDQGRWT